MYTLNCKGKLLLLEIPVVMGILNSTPDSFFSGSRFQQTDELLTRSEKMLSEGATILDIGGMSTRPGAEIISADEEIRRVIPAIQAIHARFPEAILSVDSYRPAVVSQALEAGASIINDVSALADETMLSLAVAHQAPYILMHSRGTPETMQMMTDYKDLMPDLIDFFSAQYARCLAHHVKDVMIDPGFGFAKTIDQNFALLRDLSLLQILDLPVLVGLSRKATVYKTLGISAAEALNGTTVLNTLALERGAMILRVHDVKEAVEAVKLYSRVK